MNYQITFWGKSIDSGGFFFPLVWFWWVFWIDFGWFSGLVWGFFGCFFVGFVVFWHWQATFKWDSSCGSMSLLCWSRLGPMAGTVQDVLGWLCGRVAALQDVHLHQLSCPMHPSDTGTLQHRRQEGWHCCGCSPAAPGRCHTRSTSCCAAELHHLPAQAHPRTHGAGTDKDEPLAVNCNSDRKKVTFIVHLSLGLAVFIIVVVSAAIATLPAAAQSVPSSIVFSSKAPKPLKKQLRIQVT